MTALSLQEAVEQTGTSKIDIWRAIQAGALSAKKTDDSGFAIDPDELFAVFETKQANQCRLAKDAVASLEASESPETTAALEVVETELAERNVQVAEPAAERAKVEKMAQYAALLREHDKPWWRRLVGFIWTRRGRAARQRLRERL